jgi:hypothetical protein
MQYWIETYVGLHKGFLWDAWVGGYGLFVVAAWLCAMISYRLTRSVTLTVFAAVLACGVRFYNACQPDMWLAWYPMHQDLLMMVFILGAVLAFDYWIESGSRPALAATWCMFVLGCLTKEYLYAFPFMAVSLVLMRPAVSELEKRRHLIQPALFAMFVGLLLRLRKHMYLHPRDPHFRKAVILHKPGMFMYSNLAADVITANWAPIVFASVLIGIVCAFVYIQTRKVNTGWLGKIYILIPAAIALIFLLLQIMTGSFVVPLYQLLEIPIMQVKTAQDVALIFTIVVTIRNWKRGSIAAGWLMLLWSYFPVISFIGWHYAFPGGLFRSIYWAVWVQVLAAQIFEDFPKLPAMPFARLAPQVSDRAMR